MIKAIVFDFGQTLVDSAAGFRLAEKVAKEEIFAAVKISRKSLNQQVFLDEYRHIRKFFHNNSNFSRVAIWKAVLELFAVQEKTIALEQMEKEYWERVKQKTTPFPETLIVLEKLAKQYQLGIISNTQGQKADNGHRMALFPEIESYFDVIVIAGESGIPPKPASQPFEMCLQQLSIKPQEAIYVGDDYRNDVKGSENAGLQPVWLKHRLVQRNWPEVKTTAIMIKDLNELLTLKVDNYHE
jgi:HAD superfamily hydrolase (TIGR01549 family)